MTILQYSLFSQTTRIFKKFEKFKLFKLVITLDYVMINLSRTLRSKGARTIVFLKNQGKCEYCNNDLGEDWQVDHYIPWCKGGITSFSNLKAACKTCNLKKGVKMNECIDYEKLRYFNEDFPNAKNIRICQVGAYNCVINNLVIEHQKSCSIFLPPGTGKTDLIRAISIGLVQKRKKFLGLWVFSSSIGLRKQLKENNVEEFFERMNYNPPNRIIPFIEEDRLHNTRFRNGTILESFTVQFLTANNHGKKNVDYFIDQAKFLYSKTGQYPVAVFDESHLYSTENEWGAAAYKLQAIGIPIVLVTGTPFRNDKLEIPGFNSQFIETEEKSFIKTTKTADDPLVAKIYRGNEKVCKYKLKADYEYSYSRAWNDGVILKPEPRFVDATLVNYNEILSEMPKNSSERLLRTFLMDDRTIKASVSDAIASIYRRKVTDSSSAAIVTTLSDENEFNILEKDDKTADIHAGKIAREFRRQAPDLKIIVVTVNENSEDGLERFKKQKYDVLIVKAMGVIGFDCNRIKTVLNLSNYRTLTAFIQLANRGCRLFSNMANFDIIMPKDASMLRLWHDFQNETGFIIEKTEILNQTEETVSVSPKEEKEKKDLLFDNHNLSVNPSEKRNQNDEIIELFNKKFPDWANKSNNQEKLTHYEKMSHAFGKDWLEKLSDHSVSKGERLLDCNEEENRLRQEALDIVKEITTEIRLVMKAPYSSKLFGDINKKVWSCLKNCCGFSPNQSVENIAGIDNFKKIKKCGDILKNKIIKLTEHEDFNYVNYLNKIKNNLKI